MEARCVCNRKLTATRIILECKNKKSDGFLENGCDWRWMGCAESGGRWLAV